MESGGVRLLLDLAFPAVLIGLLIAAYLRRRLPKNIARDEPLGKPYRVYTRQFDLDLAARDVAATLHANPLLRARGWVQAEPDIWQRKVAAARAAVVDADGALSERLGKAFERVSASDWAICFLVDHSGSMKDEPIIGLAATLRWCSELLTGLGAKISILGFSTVGWQGGQAATAWVADGRPKRPGRLAALLHIRYKMFDEPLVDDSWAVMLHPDILRENVDGEAIMWAGALLDKRPEPHKTLIVLSDGAPIDDSTLMHNGPNYLWRHVKQVIAEREVDPGALAAVGLNYRVDRLYARSATATDVARLPAVLADVVADLVTSRA